MPVDVGAELAQHRDQDRRRADAVAVVVAVHRDPRAACDVPEHELDGRADAAELARPVRIGRRQERARCSGIVEAAPRKYLGDHAAAPELALEHVDRPGRNWRDLDDRLDEHDPRD